MDEVKETLEKQLELLSERSKNSATDSDLHALTSAMTDVARTLRDANPFGDLCLDGEALARAFRQNTTHGKSEEAQ